MLMRVKNVLRKYGYDIKRYYPFYDAVLAKHSIQTVIDIGANNGQFARDIHTRLPDAAIYSFEPLHGTFAELQQNMKGVPKFKAFNVGLGDVSEEATILRSSFSPSSSLLAMTPLHKELYPKSKDSFEEKIVIKRLDEMLPEMKIEENLFIKMDVQGYEGNVIRGAGKALAQAKLVQVETSFTPLYEGQPLFSDIHDLLHPLGFSYIGNTAQHWNASKNEPLFEDSLFIRQ